MNTYEQLNIKHFYKILPMCRDFFEMADEPGNFNEEFFINYWHEIYKSQRGTVLVELQHGEPIAMLGIIACQEMTTGDLIFEECFFYADPLEKTNAFKLIKMMEEIAQRMDVKVIYLKHTVHLHNDRLERIYNRKGFIKKFIRYQKVL